MVNMRALLIVTVLIVYAHRPGPPVASHSEPAPPAATIEVQGDGRRRFGMRTLEGPFSPGRYVVIASVAGKRCEVRKINLHRYRHLRLYCNLG